MVTGTTTTGTSVVQTNSINSTTSSSVMEIAVASKRVSDNRRSNKPIMEKRRRARINNSLNELKTLILDAMKKDPARHSKLEKADILEMTVKHLQNLQRQQVAMSAATDPSVLSKFRAGFSECAGEVGRFPGLDTAVKRRLLQHLATCLNQGGNNNSATAGSKVVDSSQQLQVHIVPNPEVVATSANAGGIILSSAGGSGTGVQLVPTRLANGDIALVLPAAAQSHHHHQATSNGLPLLVPIPHRTSSTASATSFSSNYSPSHSPEPDSLYNNNNNVVNTTANNNHQPLSLVVRKCAEEPDEKPWRPW